METKQREIKHITISSAWCNLIDNWDKLTAMYEQNVSEKWKNHDKIGMYEFMQRLISIPDLIK